MSNLIQCLQAPELTASAKRNKKTDKPSLSSLGSLTKSRKLGRLVIVYHNFFNLYANLRSNKKLYLKKSLLRGRFS